MKRKLRTVLKLAKILFFAAVCIAVIRWDIRRWLAAAALFLAAEIALSALHETGHLIGGLVSGYRFCLWSGGPFLILKRNGRVAVRFNSDFVSQCTMIPDGDRYALYQLGGIAVNAAVFCACLAAGIPARSPALLCAAYVSFFKILANVIPGQTPPNDFTVFRMLKNSPAERENYRIYLREYEMFLNADARTAADPPLPEPPRREGYFYSCLTEQRSRHTAGNGSASDGIT